MYLRSRRGEKGRHEYNREEAPEVGTVNSRIFFCLRNDVNEVTKIGGTGGYDYRNTIVSCSTKDCSDKGVISLAGLERGMSEGERAVTTPRIGWRKLTDPGD